MYFFSLSVTSFYSDLYKFTFFFSFSVSFQSPAKITTILNDYLKNILLKNEIISQSRSVAFWFLKERFVMVFD